MNGENLILFKKYENDLKAFQMKVFMILEKLNTFGIIKTVNETGTSKMFYETGEVKKVWNYLNGKFKR